MGGFGKLDIFGTLTKKVHISAWSTPFWTRPASFERSLSALSNDASLVPIGVQDDEMGGVFLRVPLS